MATNGQFQGKGVGCQNVLVLAFRGSGLARGQIQSLQWLNCLAVYKLQSKLLLKRVLHGII